MERAITEYLLNTLWQVPLLAIGTWSLVRLVRPEPRVQHGVWLAALCLGVILPARGVVPIETLAPQPPPILIRRTLAPLGFRNVDTPRSQPHRIVPSGPAWLSSSHIVQVKPAMVQWLVRLYLGTVILALLRVAHAWREAWLLVTNARASGAHDAALESFSRRFGIKPPQVRLSSQVASPMIIGVFPPTLLLPEAFARFSGEEVSAALCHELAHIKRQDYLVNLVCQLAAVPVFWHPALHVIQQRLRMTREMACDALAARQMPSEISYAKCLFSLACNLRASRCWSPANSSMALLGGLFSKSALEERIMQLTGKTTMDFRTRLSRISAGAAVMAASLVLTAAVHLTPAMAAGSSTGAQSRVDVLPPPPPPAEPEQPVSSSEAKPLPPQRHSLKAEPGLSAGERARIERQVEAARKQAAAVAAAFNSRAFRQQMEDARRQSLQANTMLNSEQFKQQMQKMQEQVSKSRDLVNSPEFRKQMEEAQKQSFQAKAMLASPEFKQQIEEAKRQAREAAEQFKSREFNHQMEHLQERMNEMVKDFHFEYAPEKVNP